MDVIACGYWTERLHENIIAHARALPPPSDNRSRAVRGRSGVHQGPQCMGTTTDRLRYILHAVGHQS
ncbi:hypothetical protein DTO166G4_5102 [Paecilomyces variotii]|nr:hypothetical protein DTO032I3_8072 [Paecilomyces variotii]KAJ9203781.1 hypothetical protein DTO164E3_2135 [Paecilomyces variotii]KAJ9213295.1 hypothetical protein DTO166G4_5102 [Paecilomyces variotii]KAJ9228961.1 hypothetical protein DTO169E5_9010 [Paecilomyces variotii]KAJ9229596.1 hypothetical protein DTO166G5_7783 [Paecilomyces variotii]